MSLLERLNEDMKQAMRNKDKERLSVIRMIKASLQNEAIKKGSELSDDEELTVLSREVKRKRFPPELRMQAVQTWRKNKNRTAYVRNITKAIIRR